MNPRIRRAIRAGLLVTSILVLAPAASGRAASYVWGNVRSGGSGLTIPLFGRRSGSSRRRAARPGWWASAGPT